MPIPDEWDSHFEPRKYSDDNKAENPKQLQELLECFSPQMCTKLTTDAFSGNMDDLEQCLSEYTSLDVLDEDNKFICRKCTEDKEKVGWYKFLIYYVYTTAEIVFILGWQY